MAIDDSFKKPGAVPFKWEIRPGVPKVHKHQPPSCNQHRSFFESQQQSSHHNRSIPNTSQKLRPPPAGFYFQPSLELHTRSISSVPHSRSERNRFDRSILTRSESVSSGCFASPLLRQKDKNKSLHKPKPVPEPDYSSDLETLSRRSMSTRKSLSPFSDSPSSSSLSSYQSSPRVTSEEDWAGFGLF